MVSRLRAKWELWVICSLSLLFFYLLFGCPIAIFWLLLRKQSHSSDINHCIWAIESLVQRWLGGDGSLNLIECPVGFDRSGITHLATHPKLQKILSPYLHPDFPKCGNSPNTQNSYSLTLWWHLGLHNISLDAKFSVQNFTFCWSNKSMSQGT